MYIKLFYENCCHYFLVANVAERLEEVTFLNIKPRRLLKGNQAKMLCCDWSPDKRHIVSSSQVLNNILDMCKSI